MPSNYVNRNECKSWNQTIGTGMTKLSGTPCSEVIIYNNTGATLSIFDRGRSDTSQALIVDDTTVVTIRGITDSSQVSALASSAGSISCRSQFFSFSPGH